MKCDKREKTVLTDRMQQQTYNTMISDQHNNDF